MKISKSALEARAAGGSRNHGGGEAVGAEERERRMRAKREREEAIDARERGRWRKSPTPCLAARGSQNDGGGGEAIGAEDRVEDGSREIGEVAVREREEVGENLSKSALAARRESELAEEVVGAVEEKVEEKTTTAHISKRGNLYSKFSLFKVLVKNVHEMEGRWSSVATAEEDGDESRHRWRRASEQNKSGIVAAHVPPFDPGGAST
ncbi:hypothetical protein Scep_026283 [Stephania cephalantha]|uniref:Uncharacterized protein n=1 Tax=Stephania cephalantha TaxID=152367 RepID=A0AAP0HQ82_9MAGN